MNKVILMGRLTREPDIRYSQGERQMAIARYTLAVDRRGRASAGGEQIRDNYASRFARSRRSEHDDVVAGRIQTGSYTNKDGQRVYTTDVVVEEQEFAESKNANSGAAYSGAGNGGYASNQGGGYQQTSRPAPSTAINEGFMNIPDGVEDEELPFN